jgi:hypothetical protein
MLRALAPALIFAVLVGSGAGVVYGLGGPAWIVYAAIVPAVLPVLPAEERWEGPPAPALAGGERGRQACAGVSS